MFAPFLPTPPNTPENVQTLLESDNVVYTQTDNGNITCTFQGCIIGSEDDYAETHFQVEFQFSESMNADTERQLDVINVYHIIQSS